MKVLSPSKRKVLGSIVGIASACALVWGGYGLAQSGPNSGVQNWAIGRATAPVTLLEYGSLTCGHCAQFNNVVMPEIKRRYIDTGRVRYVFRPFPTPPFDLSVAMHALTLCAGPSRYYPLVDAYFERQQDIFQAANGETGPKGILFAIAEDAGGLSYSASEACLRDQGRQDQVRASSEAGNLAGVRGTPTLFVNGVLVSVRPGQTHYEVVDISNAIEIASRPRTSPPASTTAKARAKAKKR